MQLVTKIPKVQSDEFSNTTVCVLYTVHSTSTLYFVSSVSYESQLARLCCTSTSGARPQTTAATLELRVDEEAASLTRSVNERLLCHPRGTRSCCARRLDAVRPLQAPSTIISPSERN